MLRDRLIAAIRTAAYTQTHYVPGPVVAGIYADAVIEELGLDDAHKCEHPGCACERCQMDWCGDVGNIVYHQGKDE